MVGKVVAAPMADPIVGVMGDDVVGAAREGGTVPALSDGELPSIAAADVGARGAAASLRSGGGQAAPAVAAGVPEGGNGVGSVGEELLVVVLGNTCGRRGRRVRGS